MHLSYPEPETGQSAPPDFSKLPLKVHAAAALFPPMTADEFEGLKKDIAEHGIREPLTAWKGELIDGRHRLAAAIATGVDWHGHLCDLDDDIDPVAYVISHNLHRRHLTRSQLAALAVDLLPAYQRQARERQIAGKHLPANLPEGQKGESREIAAKLVGVSPRLVSDAARLQSESPDLYAKVKAGEITLNAANETSKRKDPTNQRLEERNYKRKMDRAAANRTINKPADDQEQVAAADDQDAGPCPRGGDHEEKTDDGETFCRKCLEPMAPPAPTAAPLVDEWTGTLDAIENETSFSKRLPLVLKIHDQLIGSVLGDKPDARALEVYQAAIRIVRVALGDVIDLACPPPILNRPPAETAKARAILAGIMWGIDELRQDAAERKVGAK